MAHVVEVDNQKTVPVKKRHPLAQRRLVGAPEKIAVHDEFTVS
jgi:hypothetical protein